MALSLPHFSRPTTLTQHRESLSGMLQKTGHQTYHLPGTGRGCYTWHILVAHPWSLPLSLVALLLLPHVQESITPTHKRENRSQFWVFSHQKLSTCLCSSSQHTLVPNQGLIWQSEHEAAGSQTGCGHLTATVTHDSCGRSIFMAGERTQQLC